ncbi:alkaline phosphatase D family protein [Novipirellula herctigrandis]|uniref:alkaline phosphatase D family protein n=1 Tax=Novipirellula herctigrandis TaxID=2527986 RepID=UPI003AF33A50
MSSKLLISSDGTAFKRNHANSGVTAFCLIAALAFVSTGSLVRADFASDWKGSRQWVSPDTWAHPLYGWRTENGKLIASAAPKHLLHQLTHQITDPSKSFSTTTTLQFLSTDVEKPQKISAGFAFGVQGLMDDYRHVLSGTIRSHEAGIRMDGTLFIDNTLTKQKISATEPVTLILAVSGGHATLEAVCGDQKLSVESDLPLESIKGNLALHAHSPSPHSYKRQPIEVAFLKWSGEGPALSDHAEQTFGPILWSQYTLHKRTLKLNVQFAAIGTDDDQHATLTIDGKKLKSQIDPHSRTALFRLEDLDDTDDHPYAVSYRWQGTDYTWEGMVRKQPNGPLRLAAFSCDHGYAFPLSKLVDQVLQENPDIVFFAGDQIYELYGGLFLQRKPLNTAILDYLRKYYQFGWTWRHVLKDRPSIIIPDDHDVFQGNLWGHGGRVAPDGKQEAGGYVMPAAFVNMVQRTQTAHLPDSPDPKPAEQGIGVYFTTFNYSGIPFILLEDRKFKSGPSSVLPKNRRNLSPEDVDVPEAELLGTRQEALLARWADETKDAPARVVLSQTIFCKASTHSGQTLKRSRYDLDCNGWPHTPRNRALKLLANNPATIMVHGDQHFGILLRHGIEQHGDGPLAFMVPGTANGFPRAWWPESGEVTGNHMDRYGNKMTVIAAANPEKGSNTLQPRKTDHPDMTAFKKGSGHGLITIDSAAKTATFDMWRFPLDVPKQFDGFPQTIPLDGK